MNNHLRLVLDTNLLVSYLLRPGPTVQQTVHTALNMVILQSQETFNELQRVHRRFIQRGFISAKESEWFLSLLVAVTEWIPIIEHIKACRDATDDKFLALAVNGNADYLISGDKDLLALHPFQGVLIVDPKDFLTLSKPNG